MPRPTTPVGEDLFATYTEEKKAHFKNALAEFIAAAKEAVIADDKYESC